MAPEFYWKNHGRYGPFAHILAETRQDSSLTYIGICGDEMKDFGVKPYVGSINKSLDETNQYRLIVCKHCLEKYNQEHKGPKLSKKLCEDFDLPDGE